MAGRSVSLVDMVRELREDLDAEFAAEAARRETAPSDAIETAARALKFGLTPTLRERDEEKSESMVEGEESGGRTSRLSKANHNEAGG